MASSVAYSAGKAIVTLAQTALVSDQNANTISVSFVLPETRTLVLTDFYNGILPYGKTDTITAQLSAGTGNVSFRVTEFSSQFCRVSSAGIISTIATGICSITTSVAATPTHSGATADLVIEVVKSQIDENITLTSSVRGLPLNTDDVAIISIAESTVELDKNNYVDSISVAPADKCFLTTLNSFGVRAGANAGTCIVTLMRSYKFYTNIETSTLNLEIGIAALTPRTLSAPVIKLNGVVVASVKINQSPITISTTVSAGTGLISFLSETTKICAVTTAGNITLVGAGICTISASIAASEPFASATSKVTFLVSPVLTVSAPFANNGMPALVANGNAFATMSTSVSGIFGTIDTITAGPINICYIDTQNRSRLRAGIATGNCNLTLMRTYPAELNFAPSIDTATIQIVADPVGVPCPGLSISASGTSVATAASVSGWSAGANGACYVFAGGSADTKINTGTASFSGVGTIDADFAFTSTSATQLGIWYGASGNDHNTGKLLFLGHNDNGNGGYTQGKNDGIQIYDNGTFKQVFPSNTVFANNLFMHLKLVTSNQDLKIYLYPSNSHSDNPILTLAMSAQSGSNFGIFGAGGSGGIIKNVVFNMAPAAIAPEYISQLTLSGKTEVGAVLTASASGTMGQTPITYSWYSANSLTDANPTLIIGETGTTYRVRPENLNFLIKVVANKGDTFTITQIETVTIAPSPVAAGNFSVARSSLIFDSVTANAAILTQPRSTIVGITDTRSSLFYNPPKLFGISNAGTTNCVVTDSAVGTLIATDLGSCVVALTYQQPGFATVVETATWIIGQPIPSATIFTLAPTSLAFDTETRITASNITVFANPIIT